MSSVFSKYNNQFIIRTSRLDWNDQNVILDSNLFRKVVNDLIANLKEKNSEFLALLPEASQDDQVSLLVKALKLLSTQRFEEVKAKNPDLGKIFSNPYLLDRFVEELYNYWRSHERYLVCFSDYDNDLDKKPYRTFNDTIERLNNLVRKIYREIQENITGAHPVIYRQVPAGFNIGVIAKRTQVNLPKGYEHFSQIPLIRQVLLNPPVIVEPLVNKRKGEFKLTKINPIENLELKENEWLCFPAKVGKLVIYIYFHDSFFGMAITCSNIFELCNESDLQKKPDAIYFYGLPKHFMDRFLPEKTVYFIDDKNDVVVGAIPQDKDFGYFGYVKKMVLTLHNSIMIKRGKLPVHGAMVRLTMKTGESANVVLVGDSGAGKSESIEAFRVLSGDKLSDLKIIFDDMGSLSIEEGKIKAYGTEIGAFVRIDDLDSGYVYGQLDRMIIMIPHKEPNARVVLPITTMEEVNKGYEIDYFLYANNYLEPENNRFIKKFDSYDEAIKVFREGKRLAKSTTDEIGLTSTYFANIFGPVQLKEEHEKLAETYFKKMFEQKVFVGEIFTQLGRKGMEQEGPKQAAMALFEQIMRKK
ncbi:MAG: phosphoenolpyruvate carboxykinase [Candidatus Diapherotrites archaeon]